MVGVSFEVVEKFICEIEQLRHKVDLLEAELSAYRLMFGETYQRNNSHDVLYAKRNP
jgi:hypothetical protein